MVVWAFTIAGWGTSMLAYWLRHYAQHADRLIVCDNGLEPAAVELVRGTPNADIWPTPFKGTDDSGYYVRYAAAKSKLAREHADWVLWTDCDEFISYGPKPLRDKLEVYMAAGVRAIRPYGYQMVADAFPTAPCQLTQLVRMGFRDSAYDKMCIFDPKLDVSWSSGMHSYYACDEQRNRIDAQYTGVVRLLHYRYMGRKHFEEQNAYNYAHATEEGLAKGWGYQSRPDYVAGKYSAAWYEAMRAHAEDVVLESAL